MCGRCFLGKFGKQSLDQMRLGGGALADSSASDAYGRTTDPAIIGPDGPMRPARQTTGQLDGNRLGRAATVAARESGSDLNY